MRLEYIQKKQKLSLIKLAAETIKSQILQQIIEYVFSKREIDETARMEKKYEKLKFSTIEERKARQTEISAMEVAIRRKSSCYTIAST